MFERAIKNFASKFASPTEVIGAEEVLTYKLLVTFYLKSGAKLDVRCDAITTERLASGELHSYSMEGACRGDGHFININEVAAISYTNFRN